MLAYLKALPFLVLQALRLTGVSANVRVGDFLVAVDFFCTYIVTKLISTFVLLSYVNKYIKGKK